MVQLLTALGNPPEQVIDQSILDWINEQEQARRKSYAVYDDYYEGAQTVKLTDRLKKFLMADGLSFRDNFCEVVVDVLAERLEVIGVDSKDEELDTWAWGLWQANRMDAVQLLTHSQALIKGDSYVLVSFDNAEKVVKMHHQDAHMILPRYDPNTGEMVWCSKKWTEMIDSMSKTRMNLFYPDRIEKFISRGGSHNWQQFLDDGEDTWPVPWVSADGRPLGIPIIHFRNRPNGNDFGTSELYNVIPMQDLLNKSLVDLIQALDVHAFRQRYVVGVQAAGNLESVPGAVWDLSPKDVSEQILVGEFEAADVDGMLKAIETIVQHIAGRSRTPQHLFHITGNYPSGESLKTAEAGLVSKIKNRQVGFGNAWEDAISLAYRLATSFGQEGTPMMREGTPWMGVGTLVEMVWEDPEIRNELTHLQALKEKLALGVSQHQIWREMGYDQDQIDQMDQDQQDQRVRDTNLGAAILEGFNRGQNV